ncbi:MAG: LptF/LptG family permease [bacterium]|nr:LptF/LptG family permease [bacterium]
MRLIDRHLLTATAGPFLFGWFVITFLLMIDVLFRYVDLFVSKGVPFLLATRVLGLSLGYTFALSVPMAVLVGVLMGVGQLAADHEITAMKASGLSLWALARPLFVAAALITASQVAYNHYVYPRSNHTLVNLLQDIGRQKPMLEVREQQFTDLNEHLTIFVRRKDDLTGVIGDVTIVEKGQPGDLSPRLTIAERGRIVPDHENDLLRIELEDGEIHEVPDPEDPDTYQLTRFRRHNLVVENMEQDFQISERSARSDREMDLGELMAARPPSANIRTMCTGAYANWPGRCSLRSGGSWMTTIARNWAMRAPAPSARPRPCWKTTSGPAGRRWSGPWSRTVTSRA